MVLSYFKFVNFLTTPFEISKQLILFGIKFIPGLWKIVFINTNSLINKTCRGTKITGTFMDFILILKMRIPSCLLRSEYDSIKKSCSDLPQYKLLFSNLIWASNSAGDSHIILRKSQKMEDSVSISITSPLMRHHQIIPKDGKLSLSLMASCSSLLYLSAVHTLYL